MVEDGKAGLALIAATNDLILFNYDLWNLNAIETFAEEISGFS